MSGTLAEGRSDLGVRLAPAAVAVGEVGHSEDAGQQRDGLALQPLKVAGIRKNHRFWKPSFSFRTRSSRPMTMRAVFANMTRCFS